MSKVMIVYSGGLDSTALMFHMRRLGHEVQAVSVNYGQRHARELVAAGRICAQAGIQHDVVDLSELRHVLRGSSQTDRAIPVPEGHYTAESMKATVVPNRNMILLAIAGGVAVSAGCQALAYAAHAGDHAIYPDCREEFAHAMDRAFRLCDFKELTLMRPFVEYSKAQVVKVGVQAKAPLGLTWSCYKGGDLHCGVCGTCVERREAFQVAGVEDPTLYDPDAPTLETMLAKGVAR